MRLRELHEGEPVVALEPERLGVVAPGVIGDFDDRPALGDLEDLVGDVQDGAVPVEQVHLRDLQPTTNWKSSAT